MRQFSSKLYQPHQAIGNRHSKAINKSFRKQTKRDS